MAQADEARKRAVETYANVIRRAREAAGQPAQASPQASQSAPATPGPTPTERGR